MITKNKLCEHTPGKIKFWSNGDANSYALLDEAGNWWLALLMNGEQVTERQETNLKRLAACWNSWVGVSTDDIEAMGGVARFNGKPVGELDASRAELDAANKRIAELEAGVGVALAACRALRATEAHISEMQMATTERIHALLKAAS